MEGYDNNKPRMTEKKLPSEIYSEIKHEIKNKKEKLAEGAEKLGYAYQQL